MLAIRHGQGTFKYADGHVFEGQYMNGHSHGMGTIKWADGEADVWQYHIGKPVHEGARWVSASVCQ